MSARGLALGMCAVVLAGCRERPSGRQRPPLPWTAAAVAHCGAGTPPAEAGGCPAAVDAALAVLARGGDPLDAAVAGVAVLEDDPRYNAGTGSAVRLDLQLVQMDAAVMDSGGRFGAVVGVEEVRNPVRVARAVVDTPHRLLAGEGATAFARAKGFGPWEVRTEAALEEARGLRRELDEGKGPKRWRGFDWRGAWNYEEGEKGRGEGEGEGEETGERTERGSGGQGDTVGVAVRSEDGRFAVALSTGGWTVVLRGRVGDVPVPGAGLYAGPAGAVAATGQGELIIDRELARRVYGWMEDGMSVEDAVARGLELLHGEGGLIAIDATGWAGGATPHPMGWCGKELPR